MMPYVLSGIDSDQTVLVNPGGDTYYEKNIRGGGSLYAPGLKYALLRIDGSYVYRFIYDDSGKSNSAFCFKSPAERAFIADSNSDYYGSFGSSGGNISKLLGIRAFNDYIAVFALTTSTAGLLMFRKFIDYGGGLGFGEVYSGNQGIIDTALADYGSFSGVVSNTGTKCIVWFTSKTPPYNTYLFSSTDGITWTQSSVSASFMCTTTNGSGVVIAIASDGSGSNFIYRSTNDGASFTKTDKTVAVGSYASAQNVVFFNGTFVLVDFDGLGFKIYSSTDGLSWTDRGYPFGSGLRVYHPCVGYANSNFVFCTSNRFTTSSDLASFSAVTTLSSSSNGFLGFNRYIDVVYMASYTPPTPVSLIVTNDTASTAYETAVTIDVLANDTGDSLTIAGLTQPANGTAVVANGKITYTPRTTFYGTDTFTYTVTDGATTAQGTVTVTVGAPGIVSAPVITNAPAGDIEIQQGDSYSLTLTATGGVPPYRWSMSGQSASANWLTINSSTGALSGTFNDSLASPGAVYGFQVTVTDSAVTPKSGKATLLFVLGQSPYTATIQGTLRLDTSDGVFAARKVYLYDYTTGAKVAETTSDGSTGAWSFTQVAPGEYFVVGAAQGDDLNVPRDFDALGVITVT